MGEIITASTKKPLELLWVVLALEENACPRCLTTLVDGYCSTCKETMAKELGSGEVRPTGDYLPTGPIEDTASLDNLDDGTKAPPGWVQDKDGKWHHPTWTTVPWQSTPPNHFNCKCLITDQNGVPYGDIGGYLVHYKALLQQLIEDEADRPAEHKSLVQIQIVDPLGNVSQQSMTTAEAIVMIKRELAKQAESARCGIATWEPLHILHGPQLIKIKFRCGHVVVDKPPQTITIEFLGQLCPHCS